MILELIWNKIRNEIEYFFYSIHLRKNWVTALKVKKRLDSYLIKEKIKYKLIITDETFMDPEPTVRVCVFIKDMEYKDIFKLWDKLVEIGCKNMVTKDIYNVNISCEPWRRYNASK